MKRRTSLHALIQAMSRAEKRYFTLDARKSGRNDSRYLQLFKAINNQESYDEEVLKTKFGKKLTDDKRRLYEAILRAMRDYRSQRSKTAKIKELLLDAKFLYERKLYDQVQVRLDEASQMADSLQDHLAILEINREQRRLLNTQIKNQDTDTLGDLINQSTSSLGLLNTEFEHLDAFDQLIREVQHARKANISIATSLDKRQKSLLFENEPPKSVRAQLRRFQSRAIFAQLNGDAKKMYENFRFAVDCWNNNPAIKQEEYGRYLNDAFNLLHATFTYQDAISLAPKLLDELSLENPYNPHDKSNLFQRTAAVRLFYAINYDNRRPAKEIMPPILEELKKTDLHPNSKMAILFNGAILYFIQGAANECENCLDEIINLKNNEVRKDITTSSRVLKLLCQIDQDMPVEVMESILRSELRYFNNTDQDRLTSFSSWLLKNIRKYLNLPSSDQSSFLESLQQKIQENWQGLPNELDELITKWISAKYSNRPLLDLMQTK